MKNLKQTVISLAIFTMVNAYAQQSNAVQVEIRQVKQGVDTSLTTVARIEEIDKNLQSEHPKKVKEVTTQLSECIKAANYATAHEVKNSQLIACESVAAAAMDEQYNRSAKLYAEQSKLYEKLENTLKSSQASIEAGIAEAKQSIKVLEAAKEQSLNKLISRAKTWDLENLVTAQRKELKTFISKDRNFDMEIIQTRNTVTDFENLKQQSQLSLTKLSDFAVMAYGKSLEFTDTARFHRRHLDYLEKTSGLRAGMGVIPTPTILDEPSIDINLYSRAKPTSIDVYSPQADIDDLEFLRQLLEQHGKGGD